MSSGKCGWTTSQMQLLRELNAIEREGELCENVFSSLVVF